MTTYTDSEIIEWLEGFRRIEDAWRAWEDQPLADGVEERPSAPHKIKFRQFLVEEFDLHTNPGCDEEKDPAHWSCLRGKGVWVYCDNIQRVPPKQFSMVITDDQRWKLPYETFEPWPPFWDVSYSYDYNERKFGAISDQDIKAMNYGLSESDKLLELNKAKGKVTA